MITKRERSKRTCQYCDKVLACSYNLSRHFNTCKEKKKIDAERQALIERQAFIEEKQALVEEKQALVEEQQDIYNKVSEIDKKIDTIINNKSSITNNITIQKIKQVNNISNPYDFLVPITNDLIQQGVREILASVMEQNKLITSEKDIAKRLTESVLNRSLLCTDTARKVIRWKDGDQEHHKEPIRDVKCSQLSTKFYNAITPDKSLQEYNEYVRIKKNEAHDRLLVDDSVDVESTLQPPLEAMRVISNISSRNLNNLGQSIAKLAPTYISKRTGIDDFNNLSTMINTKFKGNPSHILFQHPFGIGVWIKKVLDMYGNYEVSENVFTVQNDKGINVQISGEHLLDYIALSINYSAEQCTLFLDFVQSDENKWRQYADSEEELETLFFNNMNWIEYQTVPNANYYKQILQAFVIF